MKLRTPSHLSLPCVTSNGKRAATILDVMFVYHNSEELGILNGSGRATSAQQLGIRVLVDRQRYFGLICTAASLASHKLEQGKLPPHKLLVAQHVWPRKIKILQIQNGTRWIVACT